MCTVPRPFPREFREDAVRVARNREPGQTLKQVAADFGIAESCLRNWLKAADVEDGGQARDHGGRERGAAGGPPPDPAAGAGERGPATGPRPTCRRPSCREKAL